MVGVGSYFQTLGEEFFLQLRPPVAMFLPTDTITIAVMPQGDEIDVVIALWGCWRRRARG